MSTYKIAFRFMLVFATLFAVSNGFCTNIGSPQSVKLQFYEFWVSQKADCTGMTRVYNNPSASYQDVVPGPTFGRIAVPNGTYNCIAFKMNDVVKLTPNYTSDLGHCQIGVEVTRDLFRTGDTSISPDGARTVNGSGLVSSPIENDPYFYLSTTGDDSVNAGNIPSAPGKLHNPYVVSADNSATMVFDFTNGIQDTGSSCSPEVVTFGFR